MFIEDSAQVQASLRYTRRRLPLSNLSRTPVVSVPVSVLPTASGVTIYPERP